MDPNRFNNIFVVSFGLLQLDLSCSWWNRVLKFKGFSSSSALAQIRLCKFQNSLRHLLKKWFSAKTAKNIGGKLTGHSLLFATRHQIKRPFSHILTSIYVKIGLRAGQLRWNGLNGGQKNEKMTFLPDVEVKIKENYLLIYPQCSSRFWHKTTQEEVGQQRFPTWEVDNSVWYL